MLLSSRSFASCRIEGKASPAPILSLSTAFDDQGWRISDIDCITVPWDVRALRRSALSMIFGRHFPLSLSFISEAANTAQSNDIVFLDLLLPWRLKRQFGVRKLPPIVYVGHHDSHAAAFFMSPFEEAEVLIMDGYGDDASTSVYTGTGNRLERRWNTSVTNSLGTVYTSITKYLGFAGVDKWRFNRRFELHKNVERLARAAMLSAPRPYRSIALVRTPAEMTG